MMLDLEKIMNDPERAQYVKQEVLCQTLAGNDVPILTITSSDPVYDIRNKKFVIVTSRVHPGETPSSFIMKGILHYITGIVKFKGFYFLLTIAKQYFSFNFHKLIIKGFIVVVIV